MPDLYNPKSRIPQSDPLGEVYTYFKNASMTQYI